LGPERLTFRFFITGILTSLHYLPDQLFDELLRYPGWFVLGSITEPCAKIFYSNLTATRIEGIENIENIDIFTTIYGST
jgi:hypothetical protein